MRILTTLITIIALSGGLTLGAEEKPADFHRSLDVSLASNYAYKDTLGGLGLGYSPMLSYNYYLAHDYLFGITLLRYTLYPAADHPAQNFAYGFLFKHYLPKSWADLGSAVPWLSYSILLNQLIQDGSPGRGIAHDTRISLGSDFVLSDHHRLFLEGAWDMSDFSALDGHQDTVSAVSLGLGYRFLF